MFDLRVVNARVLLPVYAVTPLRGFFPPSLLALGRQFDKADAVEMNDVLAKEFAVTGPDRLVVRIPDILVGKPLYSLRVYSTVAVARADAAIEFGLTKPVQKVSGIDRLVQCWLLLFMTTPGSDIFSPKSGGGARSLIGKSTDRQYHSIATDLAMAAERTKNEMLSAQANVQGLPLSEKLLSSDLTQVFFDKLTSELNAVIAIQNMMGQQAQVTMG